MNKLTEFYRRLPKKSFITLSIVIFILCDLLVLGHLYGIYSNKEIFTNSVQVSFEITGADTSQVDQNTIDGLYALFHRTLVIVLALAFLFHMIMYCVLYLEYSIGKSYSKFLATIGGPILILWGLSLLIERSPIGMMFILLGSTVFSLRLGQKIHLKPENLAQ